MKTRSTIFSLFTLLVLLTSMVFQATPAAAAPSLAAANDIAAALANTPGLITAATYIHQANDNTTAVYSSPETFFPSGPDANYVAISSGNATQIGDTAYGAATQYGDNYNGVQDVTVLKLDLNVPSGHDCLLFDVQFMSEEYPEYVGQQYNDAFLAELDDTSWSVSGTDITAPLNFALAPGGKILSINSGLDYSDTRVAGTAFDNTAGNGGGTEKYPITTPITPGAHSLYLTVWDMGDDTLDSAVFLDNMFTAYTAGSCDTGVVVTPIITNIAPNSGPVAGGTTVVLTGANLTGATSVTFGGSAASCTFDSATQITCTTPAHAAGAVDVVVTAPGGSHTSPGGFTYTAGPPAFTKSYPANGATNIPINPVVSWTATSGGYLSICFDNNINGMCDSAWGNFWIGATEINIGASDYSTTYEWQVRAWGDGIFTYADGGTWFTFTTAAAPTPAPTITGLAPTSGPVAGGTTVVITGTNLTGGTVTFGGSAATCTVDSPTQITCTTPAHAAGPVDVVVTTPGGSATSTGGFTYVAALPAPDAFTKWLPANGVVDWGTYITLLWNSSANQTDYEYCYDAIINSNCDDVWASSGNEPVSAAISLAPGTTYEWQVRAVNGSGSTEADGGTWFTFTTAAYIPAPAITGLAPTSGPVAGGTTVVITGTDLTGGTVTFGGAAASCTVDSPTQITCTTPPHAAGPVDVVVTTPGGSATSTGGFTYIATPATVLPPVSFNVCPPGSHSYTSGNIVVPPAAGMGYTDVDVVFAVDTTGSMGGQIDSAKAGAIDIMNGVKATFPGAQFAVIEYKDYPPQDTLPVLVHQVLTTDNSLVSTALNGLSASGGGDLPESAGAAFIAAQGLAWRGGTVGKFIVLITDAEAQPTDVASGKSIDTILGELNTADITLLVVASGSQAYWETKAALTGDNAAVITYVADTFDEDVIDLIIGAASRTLNWTLSNPTYNSWVSSVPASYSIGADGDTYTFAVTVTVPLSATGSHAFTINYALDGDVIATELVTVTIACAPLPDDWSGTAEVISNQPIVTIGRPHIGNPQQISAYAGFGQGTNTAYLPMLFKRAFNGTYSSAFYIQNASLNTAAFSITYYNLDGSVACTVNNSLAQGSSKGYWVPAETCLPEGWVGGAVIASDNPIAVVGRPHVGSEVMSYNGLQSSGTTAHLPMLFRAAFNGTYNAAIYIQNTSNATATFSMSFYSEPGALTCTMTGQTIPARGIKNYWLPTQTCVPAGWSGGVTITSDQNVVALARTHVGAQISTYAGSNTAGTQAYVPMLFRRAFADNYTSAIYIQNVTNNAATVTISYRQNDGTETCSDTLNLPARAAERLWMPTQSCVPDGWAGGALITSTENVVTVGRSHVIAKGEVASYPGHSAAFNQAFLPMLFKTAFGNYESAMYVQNVSASPADISIIFRDASGVIGCTVTETLPAFATKGYWLPNVCAP